MVVPLSAGGFADVPARLLALRLAAALGRPVFVDNRPGAGGTIGAEFVARSAPDGHTLLFTATPHIAKAQPGKIDFASSDNGSAQHLVGALFNSMAGVELNHVPYKGSGPAMQDPALQQSLRAAGVATQVLGPQELAAFLRAEYDKWGKVVRATGATVN